MATANIITTLRTGSAATQLAFSPTSEIDISGPTDVLNFILTLIGCPGEHRAFIDAVIGIADNRTDWFDAADWDVGRRIRGADTDAVTAATIKKTAQRSRDTFNAWQTASGWTAIEAMPGGRDTRTGERHATRYRIPLLTVAQQVYDSARRSGTWKTNRGKAVRVASKPLLDQMRNKPARRERHGIGRARTDNPERWFNTAKTNALRGFEQLRERADDETARDRIRRFALDLLQLTEKPEPDPTMDRSVHSPDLDTATHEPMTMDRFVHSRAVYYPGTCSGQTAIDSQFPSSFGSEEEGAQGGGSPPLYVLGCSRRHRSSVHGSIRICRS